MATAKASKTPDTTLGAVVAHPLRSQCLTLLADRKASPAELAIELNENLGNVSYHVRKLWKAGIVELVEERPVRGAMEHFYRAIVRPMLSDEEIAALPIAGRQNHAREAIVLVAADATAALEAETFGARADYHVSRVPLRVDEAGWKELRDLHEETLERVFKIEEMCAERMGGTDDAGFPVIAFNTCFEMPERPKAS
jgi:DNA-binding transcriptional ArsR family regulator